MPALPLFSRNKAHSMAALVTARLLLVLSLANLAHMAPLHVESERVVFFAAKESGIVRPALFLAQEASLLQRQTPQTQHAQLPSARAVSNILFSKAGASFQTEFDNASVLLPVLAALLRDDQVLEAGVQGPACQLQGEPDPIAVPAGDPDFSHLPSLPFQRASHCVDGQGVRKHFSLATAAVDASFLYGPAHVHGEAHQQTTDLDLSVEQCTNTTHCVAFADSRSSSNALRAAVHLLLAREHNHIASTLTAQNPSWSPSRIATATRHHMSGVWQSIVYGELAPAILGSTVDACAAPPQAAGNELKVSE
jgi:hypothetical protein